MNKPQFVYVTYIASTPEKIFDALTNTEITKQYWFGNSNVSDWKPGSKWEHRETRDGSIRVTGTVVENARPKRLVITWAHPDEAVPEKTSRVTFDLEPVEGTVKLTVTHSELEPESKMAEAIAKGWPMVLSSLKTMLETGKPLPQIKPACK
ncbi:MAG TPA: SRPBCC family protein [Planctomycetota bacterium]|nr:SRPBCC family protein [Planctomycetota bacterium]